MLLRASLAAVRFHPVRPRHDAPSCSKSVPPQPDSSFLAFHSAQNTQTTFVAAAAAHSPFPSSSLPHKSRSPTRTNLAGWRDQSQRPWPRTDNSVREGRPISGSLESITVQIAAAWAGATRDLTGKREGDVDRGGSIAEAKLRQPHKSRSEMYITDPLGVLKIDITVSNPSALNTNDLRIQSIPKPRPHQPQCNPPSSLSSTTATAVAQARVPATAARTAPATTALYDFFTTFSRGTSLTPSRSLAVAAKSRQRSVHQNFDSVSTSNGGGHGLMARKVPWWWSCLRLRYQATIESKL